MAKASPDDRLYLAETFRATGVSDSRLFHLGFTAEEVLETSRARGSRQCVKCGDPNDADWLDSTGGYCWKCADSAVLEKLSRLNDEAANRPVRHSEGESGVMMVTPTADDIARVAAELLGTWNAETGEMDGPAYHLARKRSTGLSRRQRDEIISLVPELVTESLNPEGDDISDFHVKTNWSLLGLGDNGKGSLTIPQFTVQRLITAIGNNITKLVRDAQPRLEFGQLSFSQELRSDRGDGFCDFDPTDHRREAVYAGEPPARLLKLIPEGECRDIAKFLWGWLPEQKSYEVEERKRDKKNPREFRQREIEAATGVKRSTVSRKLDAIRAALLPHVARWPDDPEAVEPRILLPPLFTFRKYESTFLQPVVPSKNAYGRLRAAAKEAGFPEHDFSGFLKSFECQCGSLCSYLGGRACPLCCRGKRHNRDRAGIAIATALDKKLATMKAKAAREAAEKKAKEEGKPIPQRQKKQLTEEDRTKLAEQRRSCGAILGLSSLAKANESEMQKERLTRQASEVLKSNPHIHDEITLADALGIPVGKQSSRPLAKAMRLPASKSHYQGEFIHRDGAIAMFERHVGIRKPCYTRPAAIAGE